jgi:hypothetical protein
LIVCRIFGGLGNQMFQYVAGRSIALSRSDSLMLDTSAFGGQGKINRTARNLDLLDFRVSVVPENPMEILQLRYKYGIASKIASYLSKKVMNKYFYGWHPELYYLHNIKYLDGYFQSKNYAEKIKDYIRNDFRLKVELESEIVDFIKLLQNEDFVAVHVRRGDYFNNPKVKKWHGICGPKYFENGISLIKKHFPDSKLALFSDDINWSRNNIPSLENAFSISELCLKKNINLRASQELVLMSKCKHFIISNSTFSWWGQYLSKSMDKFIVAPKVWNLNPRAKDVSLMCPSWNMIDT